MKRSCGDGLSELESPHLSCHACVWPKLLQSGTIALTSAEAVEQTDGGDHFFRRSNQKTKKKLLQLIIQLVAKSLLPSCHDAAAGYSVNAVCPCASSSIIRVHTSQLGWALKLSFWEFLQMRGPILGSSCQGLYHVVSILGAPEFWKLLPYFSLNLATTYCSEFYYAYYLADF